MLLSGLELRGPELRTPIGLARVLIAREPILTLSDIFEVQELLRQASGRADYRGGGRQAIVSKEQ